MFNLLLLLFIHSVMFDSVIPWTAGSQAFLSSTISWSLLKLMSIESTISSSVTHFFCPQSFPAPGSFPMSWLFISSGQSIGASASTLVLPMNTWVVAFRIDWFDLFAIQGTLKSLLHHHSSKASILWCSVFFMVQFSHSYMTTGKTISLTRWTFVGKVTSLLFNTLSRFVIAFLPRSKCLFISWL